ncbi:hypothetical protein ScalyP_jg12180 [Parmales sp. scaly parma]|nr:hypothetical protein ScalyP_jg12180 [Parmales sp. scaly parma]|tara:strand:- start:191 stop:589 length:399 start_codon:yes stop_codon:yes gene_type:complete
MSSIVATTPAAVDSLVVAKVGKIGQKHNTPSPGEGDRVFYESLYKQNPSSLMAMEWCVAFGVLSAVEAARVNKLLIQVKAEGGRSGFSQSSQLSPPAQKQKKQKTTIEGEGISDVGISVGSGSVAIGGVSSM